MTTTELKQAILNKSFGGIMYDVTEGSTVSTLVLDNEAIANVLVEEITSNEMSNGIDKGVAGSGGSAIEHRRAQQAKQGPQRHPAHHTHQHGCGGWLPLFLRISSPLRRDRLSPLSLHALRGL